MKNGISTRVVLPIALPLVVLVTMGAFIGSIALSLLYNTKGGALTLAAVAAGGILFTASLANAQERLGFAKRGVILFAAALPLIAGAAVGTGLLGGVDDADRMINVEPLVVGPDDAPVIAAENSTEFCLGEQGACEPVTEWNVEPSAESEVVTFVFENYEAGVQHNVVITDLGGTVEAPEPGSTTYASSTVITGPDSTAFVSSDTNWSDLPPEWYFFCAIHPNMNGVGRVVTAG
ncbi:MAG: hypothetical protein WD011_05060 [Nitriliruptoraceae bacterium]